MSEPTSPLQQAIAALEAQRPQLGDAVVDTAIAPLRAQLAAIAAAGPLATPAIPAPPSAPTSAPPAATQQQLRLVTVLFLDIVGSTALTQQLDPEDVHEVMDGALARFAQIVQAHQGQVLQFAGDNLLAAFGHEATREDDAERAVRAGLALLAAGLAEGQRVQQRHGHAGFNVRVGVHTGRVLLGGGVDEDGTIRGMTVHLAARMEQTAPPGAMRISHDTWRHVAGLFDMLPQAPLQVKGRDRPMATYLVRGALPPGQARPARGVDGVATPLLGRSVEIAALLQAVDSAAASGRACGCTVLAEAGMGKSRLLDELQLILEARTASPLGVPRLLARAQPAGLGQPYRLLRDMLAHRLQIADGDSADSARQRFEQVLMPLLGADGQAPIHLLGQLIGLDYSASPHLAAMDPRQLRDRAHAAFVALLQALAAEHGQPVLLLADDLHWCDDASLDLLQQLMDAPLPLVVLGLARPVLLDRRPAWAQGGARHHRLVLEPLPLQHSQALAAALLQRMDPLATERSELAELLTRQSGGNPYYMEELLKMLIDDGVLVTEGPFGNCSRGGWPGCACRPRWLACCRRGWTRWRPTNARRCSRPASWATCSGTTPWRRWTRRRQPRCPPCSARPWCSRVKAAPSRARRKRPLATTCCTRWLTRRCSRRGAAKAMPPRRAGWPRV
jgi:class 3 adenylate cyclase